MHRFRFTGALPEPLPTPTPKLPAPPKPLPEPEKKADLKVIPPASSNVPPSSNLILPPDDPADMPMIRPLVPSDFIPSSVGQTSQPVVEPSRLIEPDQIQPPAEKLELSTEKKNTSPEILDAPQKPKAWLGLPKSRPAPVFRGSSHRPQEKEAGVPPMWQATSGSAK